MSKYIGTVSRGIKTPIIKKGDDICNIAVQSLLTATESGNIALNDKDVLCITEAVVARSQGNYATIHDIAKDVREKFGEGGEKPEVAVVFPILSRNRFAICLRGIASGASKVYVMLSYPSDEVGNHLISLDDLDGKHVDPWTSVLDENKWRELFGYQKHVFTDVDYVQYYKEIIHQQGAEAEFIFANNPKVILNYTKNVLCCDIHTRDRTKRMLQQTGATIYGLVDILSSPVDGSGFNDKYGLLGSNKATETTIKLFPRDCEQIVNEIQARIKKATGKTLEVMVYGDGAFKDPVGKIWELADPVVSPGYTDGLKGEPNELKLKYLADNEFPDLEGEQLRQAISKYIKEKSSDLKGSMATQGTTPRRYVDLLGSLADLTSGSGDKGTPIVLIQGYFSNFTD